MHFAYRRVKQYGECLTWLSSSWHFEIQARYSLRWKFKKKEKCCRLGYYFSPRIDLSDWNLTFSGKKNHILVVLKKSHCQQHWTSPGYAYFCVGVSLAYYTQFLPSITAMDLSTFRTVHFQLWGYEYEDENLKFVS